MAEESSATPTLPPEEAAPTGDHEDLGPPEEQQAEQQDMDQPLEQQMAVASSEPTQWTIEEVADWLSQAVGLPQYSQIFIDNHITGAILLKLDRDSLKELVPSVGHRVMLLESLSKLFPNLEHQLGMSAASQYARQLPGLQAVEVRGPLDGVPVTCAIEPAEHLAVHLQRIGNGILQHGYKSPDDHQTGGASSENIRLKRGRPKQAFRNKGMELALTDPPQPAAPALDNGEIEPVDSQQVKMSFIDRIRYVHNEYMRMKAQDLKADRMWRREVCKKIGLRIEEAKLADSLRWHDNLFQIAFREGEIWELQESIFSKWERWEIKGQKEAYQEQPGTKRRRRTEQGQLLRNPDTDPPPGMPLLPWRALQGLNSKETLKQLLEQVASGELSMKEMEEQGTNLKTLERMRATFVELTRSDSWQHCTQRFQPFATEEQLSVFFKEFQRKRSHEERRGKLAIPETFIGHVQRALAWEQANSSCIGQVAMAIDHVQVAHEVAALKENVVQQVELPGQHQGVGKDSLVEHRHSGSYEEVGQAADIFVVTPEPQVEVVDEKVGTEAVQEPSTAEYCPKLVDTSMSNSEAPTKVEIVEPGKAPNS